MAKSSLRNPFAYQSKISFYFGTLLFVASLPLRAQAPPIAQPVEEEFLQANPERDRFDFANRYYESGIGAKNQAAKERFLNSAIPAFERYLDAFPGGKNSAEARYRLGMSYLLTRQLDDASRQFRSVLNRHKKGHTVGAAAYKLASIEYNDRSYATAIPYFEKAAKHIAAPTARHSALYFQARCLLSIRNERRAIIVLQKLIDDPYKPNAYAEKSAQLLGHVHLKKKDYEKALTTFETIIGPKVENLFRGDALLNASLAALKLEQFDKADLYLESLLSDPKLRTWHPDAQIVIMTRAYEKGDYEEVLKSFSSSNAAPTNPEMRAKRFMLAGQAASKLGKHHDSISYFSKAERAHPQTKLAFEASYRRLLAFYNVEGVNIPDQVDAFIEIYGDQYPSSKYLQTALLMKAETLFSKRSYKKASRVYSKIRLRNVTEQNRPGFLYQKGWCLAESGDQAGAIKTLSNFLQEFPDNERAVAARAKRGEAYLTSGDHVNALIDFRNVIEVNSNEKLTSLAIQRCAEIKRKENDYDGTISYYGKLLNEFPNISKESRAHASFWVGWAHFKKNDFSQAAGYFREAQKLSPDSIGKTAGMRLVLCYYSLEDLQSLTPVTKLMLSKYPDQEIPVRILSWIGVKSYDRGDFRNAELFLTLSSTPEEPKQTLKSVWKFLGKARLKTKKFEDALPAIKNALTDEENPIALADAYLDKARALAQLGRFDDAKISIIKGLELQNQGRINAGLRIVDADIAYAEERYEEAAKNYVIVAELFVDDQELKPQALYKAAKALKAAKNTNAATYEKMLKEDFPSFTQPQDWPLPKEAASKEEKKADS